jgi:hypothetical protein
MFVRALLLSAAALWRYFTHPGKGAERRSRWKSRVTFRDGDRAARHGLGGRQASQGDRVPHAIHEQEALVTLSSEDSFPASDAPSYWAREREET